MFDCDLKCTEAFTILSGIDSGKITRCALWLFIGRKEGM